MSKIERKVKRHALGREGNRFDHFPCRCAHLGSRPQPRLSEHTAIYNPGLILLVSPSLRQSKELFAKVTGFLKDLEPAEVLEEDNKSRCALANGARVVSLPGDPDTLRGYSAPKLIIKDEAAFVSDAMQAALDPMLAVSKGR